MNAAGPWWKNALRLTSVIGRLNPMSIVLRRKRYPLSRSRIDLLDWAIAISRALVVGVFLLLLVMAVLKGVEGG